MPTSKEEILAYYDRAVGGHVFIRETLELMLDTLAARLARIHGRPRVLELGSHAGFVTERMTARCPSAHFVVWDTEPELVEIARVRLAGRDVEYRTEALAELDELRGQFDVAVSVARHHHLPHDYLSSLATLLKPGGVYILADELCPEYCFGSHRERLEHASTLLIAGGYVLTDEAELRAVQSGAGVPEHARELESLRKRALWRWYRYVVDQAITRGYFDIAVSELKSTHDDLITGSDAEHKFSPAIVEKQLSLAGFDLLGRQSIAGDSVPELQSMFVFEFERRQQH